jgi:zinc transporter, ZIP family
MGNDRPSRISKGSGGARHWIFPVFLLLGPLVLFLTTELSRKGIHTPAADDMRAPAQASPEPIHPRIRQPRILSTIVRLAYSLLPVALLAAASALFFISPDIRALLAPEEAGEMVSFEKTILQPGRFVLDLRNASRTPVKLTTVNVNDSILPFIAQPSSTIPPLGTATIYVLFPWVRGEAYTISLLTPDSATFTTSISSAEATPDPSEQNGLDLLLVGLAAGFFPLLVGITWFPSMTRAGSRPFLVISALVGGLLAYLSLAIASDALAITPQMSPLFQGISLVIVSALVTFLALRVFSNAAERDLGSERAWIFAAGIGLQNLAEGLAIGAIFSSGNGSLGVLFLIGLVAQNVDHGLRLIASTRREQRSSIARMLGLAIAGGLPAVLGVWVGEGATSPLLQVLSLSIGGGAVLESVYTAILRVRQASARQPLSPGVYAGFIAGILGMYIASIWI